MKFNEDYTIDIDSLKKEEAVACVSFLEGQRDIHELLSMNAMSIVHDSSFDHTYQKLCAASATQHTLEAKKARERISTVVDKFNLTREEIDNFSPYKGKGFTFKNMSG